MKIRGAVAGATIVVVGVLLFNIPFAQAQNRCEDLFRESHQSRHVFSEQKLIQLEPTALSKKQSTPINELIAIEGAVDSPTANRSESKYTVSVNDLGNIIIRFKDRVERDLPGYKLVVRDPQRPGYKNVTWTGYSNRFLAEAENGKLIIVKIRLRKYGHVADGLEITKENYEVLKSLESVSWLEFKVENPENADSVIKPRILIHDADANLLLSPQLTYDQFYGIVKRTKRLNVSKDTDTNSKMLITVEKMLKSIRSLHVERTRLDPETETWYERDSYKIPLKNKKTNQAFEVQVTVDRNVNAKDVQSGFEAKIYKESSVPVSVVEFKYQESLRQLIAQGLVEDVPGLQAVLDFNADVDRAMQADFEKDKGKLGHLRRDIERELQKQK